MNSELFQPTIPVGEPELMRASAYQRYLDELHAEPGGISTRISQLSPSLRADLLRFGHDGGASEVVEVMAACVRHAKRVTIHLQCGDRVVPLTVFAQERLVHCPLPMDELIGKHLLGLRVMHVEPALLRPPGDEQAALVGAEHLHHALAPLLWEMAMRGLRRELLLREVRLFPCGLQPPSEGCPAAIFSHDLTVRKTDTVSTVVKYRLSGYRARP